MSDFIFGGMENTSATTMVEHVLVDERAALDADMESLVAHELAHQWFGDLVTCRQWGHAWLNEGFATYFEHVWKEHAEGRDEYLYSLEQDLDLYLAEHGGRYARPVVTRTFAAPIDVFDRHLYQKGGLILHALRERLGDDAFWRGLAAYLARHRGTGVETRDLLRAFEDTTGRSLEGFFDQWVEQPGHPALEVSVAHRDDVLSVTVVQTQAKKDRRAFRVELPITVVDEAGAETRHRLPVRRARETFALASPSPPKRIAIDEQMAVPGTLSLELSLPLLKAQLAEGPTRMRWHAARALGERHEGRARQALAKALTDDPAWMVRAEAATALGQHRTADACALLRAGEGDGDPRVRRAVARAYGVFRGSAEAGARLTVWIDRGDRSYRVEGDLRRSLGKTRVDGAAAVLRQRLAEDGPSWASVVQAGSVDGLAALRDRDALEPVLATLRDPGTTEQLRKAALAALRGLPQIADDSALRRVVRELAEAHLDRFDPGTQIGAIGLLSTLGEGADLALIDRTVKRAGDGRVRRAAREAARRLRERPRDRPAEAALHDEVDKLRQEIRELRAEVAKAKPEEGEDDSGENA